MKYVLLPLLAIALLYSLGCVRYVSSTPITHPYSVENRVMLDRGPNGLAISRTVARQLSRLMLRAIREQKEPDACVLSYRVWFRQTDSARMVDIYALTLAEDDSADNVSVYSHTGLICPEGVPSVHGHILRDWFLPDPSGPDSATLVRSRAPFDVLAYRAYNDSSFGLALFWPGERR